MKKSLRSVFGFLVLMVATAVANASSYQSEVGFGLLDLDMDFGSDSLRADGFFIGGVFYLEPVDSSKGPISEAAFIQRADRIAVAYANLNIDDVDMEETSTIVSARIVSETDVIFEVGFEKSELEYGSFSGDSDSFNLGLGFFFNPLSEGVFSYTVVDSFGGVDSNIFSFNGKVLDIDANMPIAFTGGIQMINGDGGDGENVNIGVEVFPTRTFSIGAELGFGSIEDADIRTIELSGEYFFTPEAYVNISYSVETEEEGLSEFDTDTIALVTNLRF